MASSNIKDSLEESQPSFENIKHETKIQQKNNHENVDMKKDQVSEELDLELGVHPRAKLNENQINQQKSNAFNNDRNEIVTPLLLHYKVPNICYK